MPTKKVTKLEPAETVLVLRTCTEDLTSHDDFKWPESGPVKCSDWLPTASCGHGLHGLLWGEGDGSLLNWSEKAKALVVRVEKHSLVDLQGKVKFPAGVVEFCGGLKDAADYISEHGGAGRAIVRGTATAGDGGTATAGDGGTATAGVGGTATAGYRGTATEGDGGTATAGDGGTGTAGDGGTATAGYRGTATAGDGGTATAGYRGTATAGVGGTATAGDGGTQTAGVRATATAGDGDAASVGDGGTQTVGDRGTATAGAAGVICIDFWNGRRYKMRIAHVKDEDGDV